MLFFGLRRFSASFAGGTGVASAGLPSPNGGATMAVFKKVGGFFRGSKLTNDSLTPDVGGVGTVAKGLGFTIGASEGCGGGVARRRSSLRVYVPITRTMIADQHSD